MAASEPPFIEFLDKFVFEFDKFFRNVAPTKRYNSNLVESYALSVNAITDTQCQVVKNLSSLLVRLLEEANIYRPRTPEYRALESVPNPWLKYGGEPDTLTMDSMKHTIALQRDYLVLELCRSEDLQKQLKEREDYIVTITEERDNLARKLLAHKASLSQQEQERLRSHIETATKAKVEDEPESLINSFVRKEFNGLQFFGIIARYKAPYFKVSSCTGFPISK